MTVKDRYKVGTLLKDMGKLGVVYRMIESGTLETQAPIIKWRFNYEIYYFDGGVTVMGHETLRRLIESGAIEILQCSEEDLKIEETNENG